MNNFKLFRLNDDTYPEGSPLRGLEVRVDQTAAYQLDHYDYPDYVYVDDPEWEYTDNQGHEHHRDGDDYPTLRKIEDDCPGCFYCYDSGETYTWTHYECVGCGEVIHNVGKKQERYVPQIPVYTEITLTREFPTTENWDLMGIEPIECERSVNRVIATYRPTWDEWLMLVEENNRLVQEAVSNG